MKNLLYVTILCLAFVSGLFIGYHSVSINGKIINDTIVVIDTIGYYQPIPKDSTIIRYATVTVPKVTHITDTTYVCVDNDTYGDSVSVVLPIEQKHYADSTYDAWISGCMPYLDSIKIYNQQTQITIREKPKRWGVGVQAGFGITPKNVQPYIGIGIHYNIITF